MSSRSAEASVRLPAAVRTALLVLASGVLFAAAAALDPVIATWRASRAPVTPDERRAIGEAVENANAILQDFHASGGVPTLLNDLPYSTALRHQVFRELGLLRDAGLLMVLDLADAVPIRLDRIAPDEVEALVYEEWNYLYQRTSDRRTVEPLRGLAQGFRYRLSRREGRWVVVGWEPEDVPPPPGAGEAWW